MYASPGGARMLRALFLFFLMTTGSALGGPLASALAQPPDVETEAPPATHIVTEADGVTSPAEPTLELVNEKADVALLAGHNAWMLVCCALVLFMTAPGLAMFYSGLVRKKNVLSVMMQCLFLMGLMTVLWATYGYSLAFGGSGGWIGNGDYLFMNGVSRTWYEEPFNDGNANSRWDKDESFEDLNLNGAHDAHPVTPMYFDEGYNNIPMLTHMLFQGMFFIITPALICGAFAERMKFSTMTVFLVLWGTLVYCPLCHWVWDGGPLAFVPTGAAEGEGILGGALDFAGGTVVHISSGISALVCALMIGRRLGWGNDDMRPHNLTYTAIGASMLWVGWFGFNAGSELLSDDLTSSAFAVTHFSAAAGAVAWAVAEWLTRGKPSVLGAASGAVAGLVCITPAAGFVNTMPSLVMGAAAGIVCYFACSTIKSRFGYDDALDAFGVHGVGGALGAVLTGVFATRACWNIDDGHPLGLIEGSSRVFFGQLAAVGVTVVFSVVATFILLKLLDLTMGLRVSPEQEMRGLDLSQQGEEGYIFV